MSIVRVAVGMCAVDLNPPPAYRAGDLARLPATALRFVVTVVLLALFFGWVDLDAVRDALAHADSGWFMAAVAAYVVGQLANGLAWRHLLADSGIAVTLGEMIRHDLGSVFWSTVVPGGVAGEVVKGVRIARAQGGGPTVATAILAARLVGGGSAGVVGLVMLPWSLTVQGHAAAAVVVLGGTAGAGATGLYLLRRVPTLLSRWLPRGRFPSASALARAAIATSVAHLSFAATTAACFAAAGHPLGLADATWVSVATSLAEIVPVSVGGFGVRELAMTLLGGQLVPPAAAASAAILYSAAFFGVVLLGGASELARSAASRG